MTMSVEAAPVGNNEPASPISLAELNPADRRIAKLGAEVLADIGLELWAQQFTQGNGEQ